MTLALLAAGAWAQTTPDWRRIGSTSVDLMLAAPATGPVNQVWFSADGSQLYARTASGKIFQTFDFQNWTPTTAPEPPVAMSATAERTPETGAELIAGANGNVLYAIGRNLSRSEDGGRTWTNLTAFQSQSVIGPGQHGVAPSPVNPDELVVANDYGVWRSMDGGLSWSGGNQFLPNLPVQKILSMPAGAAGTRIQVDRLGVLELPPGGSVWLPTPGARPDDTALLQRYSAATRANVTAFAAPGDVVYAGTDDGRLFISVDKGLTFPDSRPVGNGRVERIFTDAAQPDIAIAALSGAGPHVVRTMNRGVFWDSMDGNLPPTPARAVTADRAAGAVYVATDKGVFYTRVALDTASRDAVAWINLTETLPAAPARDVKLDAAGVQLYVALDGYGVFATAAPHRLRTLRILNAGDYSSRAAAPGSLLSVIGGKVSSVRGGNLSYPVLAASDSESQIQVPFEAAGPSVPLELDTADGLVRRDLSVQPVSPVILVSRDGVPMLFDADSGMPLDAAHGARVNGRLQIWMTGLGKVRPDWKAGMQAPMENPPAVVANVRAFLDRTPLQVTKATLQPGYVGFYVIEVQLPAVTNAGTAELYVSADGQDSNRVQLGLGSVNQ